MDYRTEHLIESYFAGTLSDAERSELKTLLASNREAAAEFAWQKRLAGQLSGLSLAESIQNKQWRAAIKAPAARAVFMWSKALVAAAATVVLLIAALFAFPLFLGTDTKDLVAQSFEHFPNKMRFKNLGEVDTTAGPEVIAAFAAYDRQDYASAADQLSSVAAAHPDRMDYAFYQGIALLGAKKYASAAGVLAAVSNATSTYRTPAMYFAGVAYAGAQDNTQAKKYLNDCLAAPDGVPYRARAQALLKSMK